jgi:dephospho-CoA kinase
MYATVQRRVNESAASEAFAEKGDVEEVTTRRAIACGVLRVGLTGGIGSGKSTVAALLGRRGALLIDADAIARQVVEPGGAAYAPVVERFGPAVVRSDGSLDRAALASRVFSDPAALADLNRITHPVIGAVVLDRLAELTATAGDGGVIVVDQPLLSAATVAAYRIDTVVVVDTPTETAVDRLVRHRGFRDDDARARIAAQISRDERLAMADLVVDNTGAPAHLDEQVDRLWSELVARSRANGPGRP